MKRFPCDNIQLLRIGAVTGLELGHMAGWIAGSALLAAGTLLVGYSLGFRAGARRSSLAKDLRISAQEQRIARLEKALTTEPGALQAKAQTGIGEQLDRASKSTQSLGKT